jgi:NUBPL iron-transfer P-loop NTPase
MLGLPVGQPPTTTLDGKIVPVDRHKLKVMSVGMLTGDDAPAVLRGPTVGKYLSGAIPIASESAVLKTPCARMPTSRERT